MSERIDVRRRHRDRALDGVLWAQRMLCRYEAQAVEDWANGNASEE